MSEPTYRDRCDGYVPETREYGDLEPTYHALLGSPYQGRHVTRRVPVTLALADELNRRADLWWWAQVDPGGAESPEHWSRFDGWDVRVGIDVRTWNYREVNDWKGRDEIRKAGTWRLYFNDQCVYGGDVRDPGAALRSIEATIGKLRGLPIEWRNDTDYRPLIEGRQVYYRDEPAVLGHWMPEQGCVMVHAVNGPFRPHAYDLDNESDTPAFFESSVEAKVHLLSEDIWWWRKRQFPGAAGEADTKPEEGDE